jgi:preprotein translocase subunit SecA
MFVDLMNDIYTTFGERFLKVQLIVEPPPPPPPSMLGGNGPRGGPTKRYNALGILEDIPSEETASDDGGAVALDVGPAEVPAEKPVAARKDPVIVGAGRARSLSSVSSAPANIDWSTVGRNDPCPCGSGKKFKKCHGAQM